MPFITGEDDWIRSHYEQVPHETVEFCGDLTGASMLNLGCGEMLTDFGLLNLGVRQIIGLDIVKKDDDFIERAAARLRAKAYPISDDYRERLSYQAYDGRTFPLTDASCDFVFSWSAFEHVADVPAALAEIWRILRHGARAFIQVYPWYHCAQGSHLKDYIDEPFFHLSRAGDWVRAKLEAHVEVHSAQQDFILGHMFREYTTLNRYSANQFYADVVRTGFKVDKARVIAHDENLSFAPDNVPFSDLMISGTKMLLRKP